MVAGFFYGFGGFMTFATRLAGANNDQKAPRTLRHAGLGYFRLQTSDF